MLKACRFVGGSGRVALACAVLALAQVGCGGESVTASGTDMIGISTSQLMITVENKSGLALTNISVQIEPVGGQTVFTTFVGRMENAEGRDLSLGQFVGRDGTPFDLRVVRPKAVRVTAEDMTGKTYEAVVPWQM